MLNLKNNIESLKELAERKNTVNTLSDHKINPYDRGPIESVRNRLYGEIALYGAGMVAVSVYYAIKTLYPECQVISFIVSEKKDNPDRIGQIPVLSLDEFCKHKEKDQVRILVAAPENHHQAITRELKKRGLRDVICIDSRKEAVLMERYYERIKQFPSIHSYHHKGQERKSISLKVYMAKFHKDQPLENAWEMPGWVSPIQAGAALTDRSVAHIKDNTGDNISEKNGNYSELSALYWIWKNEEHGERVHDYLGLFHYRRILEVTEEDMACMAENDIDIILPYPTIHYPSINEHHRRYVKDQDWEAMISALEELEPEYARAMPEIFAQPYFYNYNMFIARRKIFDEFCGWLFPVLKRTEELSSPKGWERADRYMGYLGENLTTLYFMYHKNDLRAAHAGRLMLV